MFLHRLNFSAIESGMPAKIKFKKSVLAHCMHSIFSTNDINKLLLSSIFLSAFVVPHVHAQDLSVDAKQDATADVASASAAATENTVAENKIPLPHLNDPNLSQQLEDAARQQGLPASKIDLIDDKLNQSQNQTQQAAEIDSLLMLQQQQKNPNNDQGFKAITFDDLEELPVNQVDPAFAAEINQVAEGAKTEALNFRNGMSKQTEMSVAEPTQQELIDIGQAPINVDSLIQDIRADSQIQVSENEAGRTFIDHGQDRTAEENKKLNVFQRIIQKVRPKLNNTVIVEKIHVDVEGATPPLAANIKAKLSIFTVEAFSDFNSSVPQLRTLANQAAQAVGYYNAQFKFKKQSNNKLQVIVTRNEPVLIGEQNIEFSGAGENLPQLQVIRVLPDQEAGDIRNQGLYENTKARIVEAANNNGFFDSYWRLHDLKILQPQNKADIHLKYETGNRYKIGQVEFRMSDPTKPFPVDLDILEKLAPWKDGADYTAWRVNALSNNLTNTRYFNYTLVDAIKPDPIQKPLELPPDLQALVDARKISEGELMADNRNKVVAASAEEVTQNVVDEQTFAGTTPKEQLPAARMQQTEQQDKQAEIERLQQQARIDQKIPVIVTLNADKLNNLEAGIGYGTDTGVRLRSQYRRAIVNNRGHSFDANMEVSQIRQAFDGKYNIPYNHPLNDFVSIVGGYEREERDDVGNNLNLLIESAVFGADRIIKGSRKEWQHVFGVRYRLDRITQNGVIENEDDLPDAFMIPGAKPEQQSLLLGYQVSKTNSDNRVNPTKGFKQTYSVQLGSDALLTDTNMAIVDATWKTLYSFGKNDVHQLVGGTQLGYIFTQDFEKVPYNLRYFAGGDQSLRGFDYKSLSPEEFGYKVGGQGLAVGSLEYNYQFKDGWRAAIFTDFGNAFDQKFSNDVEYSLGLGIRWKSPIGPIRLDVASGLSDEGHPIRLHFFIGSQL